MASRRSRSGRATLTVNILLCRLCLLMARRCDSTPRGRRARSRSAPPVDNPPTSGRGILGGKVAGAAPPQREERAFASDIRQIRDILRRQCFGRSRGAQGVSVKNGAGGTTVRRRPARPKGIACHEPRRGRGRGRGGSQSRRIEPAHGRPARLATGRASPRDGATSLPVGERVGQPLLARASGSPLFSKRSSARR